MDLFSHLYASGATEFENFFLFAELEQEKARLLRKKPQADTPVATVEPLPRPRMPSILKNSKTRGNEAQQPVQPSPQPVTKPVPEMRKAGSEASSGSSISSLSNDDNNL